MELAYLFPLAIAVTTVAVSSGIAGSNFWIPIYLLLVGLEPRTAFWAALATMLFGFGSGVVRNLRAGTIDPTTIRRIAPYALPAAAVGALLSKRLPVQALLTAFAVFAVLYGLYLLLAPASTNTEPPFPNQSANPAPRGLQAIAFTAGFLQGIIATGAGALLSPSLLRDTRIQPPAAAVGSAVVLVLMCTLVSVTLRIDSALFQALRENAGQIATVLAFGAPGAVLGGQLGPRVAGWFPRVLARRYVGGLLVLVGGLVGLRV